MAPIYSQYGQNKIEFNCTIFYLLFCLFVLFSHKKKSFHKKKISFHQEKKIFPSLDCMFDLLAGGSMIKWPVQVVCCRSIAK